MLPLGIGDFLFATDNRQQATGNRQQATDNRQQATGNRQQATGNRQQATGNIPDRLYSYILLSIEWI
jgi:uncharacterized protein YjbJ (UPF0337 family)